MRLPAGCVIVLLGCSSGSLSRPDAGAPTDAGSLADAVRLDRITDGDVTTAAGFCAEWMAIWARFPGCRVLDDKGALPQPYGCDRFAASVRAGRVSWDLASAEACLLPVQYGMGPECGYDWGRCSGTTPQVELGNACSPYALAPECKGDAFCFAIAPGACTGRCAPRRNEGEACTRHGDCVAGLACDGTGHCALSVGAAGACSAFTTPLACQPAGASCNPAAVQPVCAWGTVCDPIAMTCRAPGKPGDACGGGGDAPCGWDASARCDVASKTCFICWE